VIEDELRTLLASRSDELPDNLARVGDVHARVTGIRRRRAVATTLALVLVVAAGVLFTRLPGAPETLPAGVPAPPWFDDKGQVRALPGWSFHNAGLEITGSDTVRGVPIFDPGTETRYLVMTWCERKGDLTIRNTENGENVVARCRTRVGDHFEGATVVTPEQAARLSALSARDPSSVEMTPGSPGRWIVGGQQARAPERLPDNVDIGGPWLADGRRTPDGTTVRITVPQRFQLQVECVAGVRLAFRVPAGELGSLTCDPTAPADARVSDMEAGRITLTVTAQDLSRLGLRRGQQVALTVSRSGTETNQWRIYPLGR
jgi:hypothetical protein